jgi:hypothetical protein
MKNKFFLLILLIILVGGVLVWFGLDHLVLPKEPQLVGEEVIDQVTPEPTPTLLVYLNQEFDFRLNYPLAWGVPQEKRIVPPEQHLYQIILNSQKGGYRIDIYDQPSPISLGSFVRGYFPAVEWTNEVEVNGQEALKFFLPRSGLGPEGVGAFAFRKGPYILVIATPVLEGERGEIVEDQILNNLAESFEWVE